MWKYEILSALSSISHQQSNDKCNDVDVSETVNLGGDHIKLILECLQACLVNNDGMFGLFVGS